MDPLQQLMAAINGIKAKVNDAIKGLPPIAQYEASGEIAHCLRVMTNYGGELCNQVTALETQATAVVAAIQEKAKTEAVTAAMEKLKSDGEFISKADHTSAVTAAVGAKEKEVKDGVAAAAQAEKLIGTRREELISAKTLPAIVAHKVPSKLLEGDGYKDNASKIAARFKTLAESTGISAEATDLDTDQKAVVEGIAELGLEAGDETTFSTRIGLMKTAVTAAKSKKAGGEPEINPLQGAGGGSGGGESGTEGFRPSLL